MTTEVVEEFEAGLDRDIEVWSQAVGKNIGLSELEKFNPYHDQLGRFASSTGPKDPSAVKTRQDLEAYSQLPGYTDGKYNYYTHAVRTDSELKSITETGIRPNQSGTVFASESPTVRERGAGYVLFRQAVDKDQSRAGTDFVEAGLTYRERRFSGTVSASAIVRVVPTVTDKTGFRIRADELAANILRGKVSATEAKDLPTPYSSWPSLVQKSEISKAIGKDMVETAEKQELKIAQAFVAAVDAVKKQFSLKALEEAVVAGPSSVITSLDLRKRLLAAARGQGLSPQALSFSEALRLAYNAGVDYEIVALGKVPAVVQKAKKPTVGVELAFDYLAEEAVQFLRDYDFTLIREVTDSTLEAIQDTLVEGFQAGRTPAQMARELRGIIGLTKMQAKAVRNYRAALQSGDETQLLGTLGRALRDGRFDRSVLAEVEGRKFLTPGKIDQMVERYEDRFLNYRAMAIARTESLRASNAGQQEVWRQAVNQDLLDADTKRGWVLTRDARLCPICRQVPGMNLPGVPLGEQFATPNGLYEYPPIHVHCRCSTVLKFD